MMKLGKTMQDIYLENKAKELGFDLKIINSLYILNDGKRWATNSYSAGVIEGFLKGVEYEWRNNA